MIRGRAREGGVGGGVDGTSAGRCGWTVAVSVAGRHELDLEVEGMI